MRLFGLCVYLSLCMLTATTTKAEGLLRSISETINSESGGAQIPEPSAGFLPKKEYKIEKNVLIGALLDVFESNRVTTSTIDKDLCRINTDYVVGPTYYALGGLLGSNSTRYKYGISCKEKGTGILALNIIGRIESSGSSVQSWRDVSADNPEVVKAIEWWLYEQFEKEVKNKG